MCRTPLLLFVALALTAPLAGAARNLAAGLPASFDPQPNYGPSTDAGDPLQLTDGAPASGKGQLWVRKEAVGWAHPKQPIFISFDLGEPKAIGSVSLRTAAGQAGVYWPTAIGLFLSDDGQTWRDAGEIISQSIEEGLPEPMAYAEHRFTLRNVAARARYVALCVARGGSGFFVTDEVEISEDESGAPPRTLPVVGDLAAVRKSIHEGQSARMALRRLGLDLSRLREIVQRAPLPPGEKTAFLTELEQQVATARTQAPPVAEPLRTVIPITPAQAQLLAFHGRLLEKQGYPRLYFTKTHRNAYLGWLETPALKKQEPIHLAYRQMVDETRADLFLATNASGEQAQVTLKLDAPAEALTVRYCPWTDTPQLEPVATALLPAEGDNGEWHIPLPPGMTTKIWVSVDAGKLPPGKHTYQGTLSGAGTSPTPVSLSTEISPLKMGRPSLHLGVWDYTNSQSSYGLNTANREAALALMRSHGVDSPWATPALLPMPSEADFDAQDRLLPDRLDFSRFDAWLKLWPDARRYMVFLNVKDQIGGARVGTPQFGPRVEAWAQALWQHAGLRGVKPGQLILLLVDEPKTDAQDQLLVAWAEPIRDAVPELKIWSDPVWKDPLASAHPAAFELPDILCPNSGTLAKGGPATVAFYQAKRAEGKPLETYSCSALAPHADPSRYFRMLPWSGWPLRVQAVGFWSFGDTGGLADCWAAYEPSRGIWYAPAFIGRDSATDTLHWQAVREGVLDYEYLRMLERSLPTITEAPLRAEAEALLSDAAVAALFHGWTQADSAAWRGATHPEAPDLHRAKVLALLERLPTPKK